MSKDEIQFVDGLIVKPPRDGAPEFVKGSMSIKRLELIAWLTAREGDWVNVDIKEAKSGKWYAAVDNWKPKEGGGNAERPQRREAPAPAPSNDNPFPDDDIHFDGGR